MDVSEGATLSPATCAELRRILDQYDMVLRARQAVEHSRTMVEREIRLRWLEEMARGGVANVGLRRARRKQRLQEWIDGIATR